MGNRRYFLLFICYCLLNSILPAPLTDSLVDGDFCTNDDLLKYENGKEYSYEYSTQTDLWINDVSKESKSSVELKAKVFVRSVKPCLYLLRLEDASLTGESINQADAQSVLQSLNDNSVQFRLNSKGELDSNVDFTEGDSAWSRNVKRGILSALQVRSSNSLRNLDQSLDNTNDAKSAVLYETDVLGRCRTTYLVKDPSSADVTVLKKKSLQRCTLNENSKSSAVQYVPYKSIPEFYQGRLFIETHECESKIKNGLIDSVECEEKSTYKVGSRGDKGVQAVVKQNLKYLNVASGYDRRAHGPFETHNIKFEFSDKSVEDLELKNFNFDKYLSDLCSRVSNGEGLENEHSNNFRALVNTLETKSKPDLYSLYTTYKARCDMARLTFFQALVFANTEASFETSLKILDETTPSEIGININEIPVLTALARLQEPSLNFLKNLKTHLQSKTTDFPYLKKLYLIYSTLVKTYCTKNQCDSQLLDDFSSIFAANLGSNCDDSNNKQLVTTSLKAIGNIGSFKNVDTLVQCATNQANNLETRISAIQAFRRFDVNTIINTQGLTALLKNREEETEVRINAFQVLIQSIETERFQIFARDGLPELLEKEEDIQLLTYVIDYAREHGLTALLNPVLANQQLKEKFNINFKELSWNNFKYRYSLAKDGAFELDTSVIYVSDKSFIPRSIRLNATIHMFGMSINFADITLRTEGLEDILKGLLIDRLTSEQLMKRILSNPEELIEVVKLIADKLKYTRSKPFLSILIRVYGSDVFYSELDTIEKLKALSDFLRNPRENILYKQVDTIKNIFLIDSRVRQPLLNGFEFNTFMDSSLGLLIVKKSSKTETKDTRDFKINNFYSASFAVNKRFEVQINKNNRLSLKKKSFLNSRLRIDVTGKKTNETVEYNWNLTPLKEIPLVVFDGKFYKLSNNQYSEVKQFSVERHRVERCTSDNFHNGFGIDLCLLIDRPQLGSIKESLKPVDFDKVLNNFSDQDDDDDEDDDDDDNDDDDDDEKVYGSVKRPKLVLSGPYRYEIKLKNPEDIKTITLNGKQSKTDVSKSINLALKTVSSSNQAENRLEFSYSRNRVDTNRGIERHLNIELKNSKSQDVRFKLSGDIVYKKQQTLVASLQLENKIIRPATLNLEFSRNKESDNIVPTYKIQGLLDSKLRDPKYKKFLWTITPNGRNIESNLIIEKSDSTTEQKLVKIAEGKLSLKSRSESSVDYDVNFQLETKRPSKLNVNGRIGGNLLESNNELSIEYSGPRITLTEPAKIRIGHAFDVSSPGSKSFIEFGAKLASRNIDHNVKILFEANALEMKLNHIEFQVKTPKSKAQNNDLPFIVFVSKNIKIDGNDKTVQLTAGIDNFLIDLTSRDSKIAQSLKKLDSNNIVKSVSIEYIRKSNSDKGTLEASLKAKKNGILFANIQTTLSGSLKQIRSNPLEVSKQLFGSNLQIKVFENSAAVDAKLDVESSQSKKKHALNFDLKTDGLLRILLKVISIKTKLNFNDNKVDAEYEMKKIGEVKSFALLAKSAQVRAGSDGFKEFDVEYTKVLGSSQQLKSSGTIRYKFKDVKNFESALDITNNFRYNLNVKNERKLEGKIFGIHDISLTYAHLDAQKAERELRVLIDNESEDKTLILNILARKGAPNTLKNLNDLDYLVDLNTKNKFWYDDEKRKLENGANSLVFKVKKMGIDVNAKCSGALNRQTNIFNLDAELNADFPAIITESGKVNTLKHKLSLSKDLNGKSKSIKGSLETNQANINKLFKKLNVEYSRQAVDSNLTSIILDVKAIGATENTHYMTLSLDRNNCKDSLASSAKDSEDDESNKFKKLCSGTRINLKQNILENIISVESRKIKGKSVDISECTAQTKLVRHKQIDPSYSYTLEILGSLECKNLVFVKKELSVRRFSEASRDDRTTSELKLHAQSDLYFESRRVEIKHKKFYSKSGHFDVNWERSSAKLFTILFSYNRDLDSTTKKLSRGNYVLKTELGTSAYKNCELNIESKYNYYNRFSCKVKTSKLPVELSYGYSLKVNNLKDLPNGKRDMDLNIDLPSRRQLRVEYQSNRAVLGQQQFDDDEDSNNEREFNSTIRYYWDNTNDKSKVLLLNLRRDNYDKTNSKFTAEASSPSFKALRLVVDRKRLFNETDIKATISYELKNNVQNELTIQSQLVSDFDSNKLSLELSLARPSFNILYQNKFNKLNGRLQYLSVRLGKLLKFSVDKEYDPENRLIRLELVSPDESKFAVESSTQTTSRNVYIVNTSLKQLSTGQILSTLESSFDSNNNIFDVNVDAKKAGNKYRLNVGFYNESLANAVIKHVNNNNKIMGFGSLQIVPINDLEITDNNDNRYLQLSLSWNRLWNTIYNDILANQGQEIKAVENSGFNSYFGDVYGSLVNDLKPTLDTVRPERKQVRNEIKQLLLILAEFYSNALPDKTKADLLNKFESNKKMNEEEEKNLETLPLHKRLAYKYNKLAKNLNALHFRVKKFSKVLASYIPRLTMINYNKQDQSNRMAPLFDNNLVAQRPTNNARNLYEFNAEYRDLLRRLSTRFLSIKSGLLRNIQGANLRSLINKYKFRSLRDYTMVSHIFNRKNLVTFNGESIILKARCRFLLAHELTRNQFSVILNSNSDKFSISVSAYGLPTIDINGDSASIKGKNLALPHTITLSDKNARIVVKRSFNSVNVQVNNDLLVTCYEDSKSCSVALTRWYTGKVNGLLGKSNHNRDQVDEDAWYLDSSCKLPSVQPKSLSEEAVSTCYSIFGKHRRAIFRNALLAINPIGWQKLCEFALNADMNNKCNVMRAFVNHARLRQIEVNEPNECFKCQAKGKSILIGDKYSGKSSDLFDNGNDYVFVFLPCDKNKYSIDFSSSAKSLISKNPGHRFYFVKVHGNNGASVYQSESGQLFNFDPKKAYQTISEDKSSDIQKNDLYNALFLAGSIFTNRLAQNRHIIIVGCGNCVKYSSRASILLERLLSKRNIIVSAWDDYNIQDSDLVDENIFGYGQGNVFLSKKASKSVETDSEESYSFEHKIDLCSRLAVKTKGNVFNINYIRQPEIFEKVAEKVAQLTPNYQEKLGTCERVDTPFGDVDDFTYTRIKDD